METRTNAIKFYFDRHIWSKLINMPDKERDNLEALIRPLREQSQIRIYYSPTGILEMVQGVFLEKHYQTCREELKLASRLTSERFLDNPWDHVRRAAYAFLGMPFKEPDLSFLNLCREFIVLPYMHMKPKIDKLRKLTHWDENWADSLIDIKSRLRKEFGLEQTDGTDRTDAEKFRSNRGIMFRIQRHWPYFCQHFSLPEEIKNLSLVKVINEFHSFRYWINYRITYENKMLFDNRTPKPSDYLDWEQVVYLNIMDYLVTEDNKLITIFKESKDEGELNGAWMHFSDFVSSLKGILPPKRAPDTTYEKWYPAKQP